MKYLHCIRVFNIGTSHGILSWFKQFYPKVNKMLNPNKYFKIEKYFIPNKG